MFENLKTAVVTAVAVFLAVVSFSSMATDMAGSTYSTTEIQRYQYLKTGVVEGTRTVSIEMEANYAVRASGAAAGAALLGVAAQKANNPLAQFVLASLGGVAGERVAAKVGREMRPAQEIVVRLDQGGYVVVVQEVDGQWPIYQGDRVRLVEGQQVRVVPIR